MWTDEDMLKAIKVADMLWEQKIKAKIKELDTPHFFEQFPEDRLALITIDTLKELLGG